MLPKVISQQKQQKPCRDKLPPSEKHARHLKASRTVIIMPGILFHDHFYERLIMLLTRNRMRIQEEQRLQTRK